MSQAVGTAPAGLEWRRMSMSSDCRKGWEQGPGRQKGSRVQVSQGLEGLKNLGFV